MTQDRRRWSGPALIPCLRNQHEPHPTSLAVRLGCGDLRLRFLEQMGTFGFAKLKRAVRDLDQEIRTIDATLLVIPNVKNLDAMPLGPSLDQGVPVEFLHVLPLP